MISFVAPGSFENLSFFTNRIILPSGNLYIDAENPIFYISCKLSDDIVRNELNEAFKKYFGKDITFKIIGREHEQADWRYFGVVFPGTRADECTGCEDCLSKCPQGIDIPTELEKVTEFFGPSPE